MTTNKWSHASILSAGQYRALEIRPEEESLSHELYRFMLRLRMCEEQLAEEYHPADEMRCPVHFCIGQEAVPAALSLLAKQDDYLFSHHRSHGYYLAKQAPMDALFAELYGKSVGANGGVAGSQDISSPDHQFFSGAILAGATGIAMGTALGIQMCGQKKVAIAGFGESATDEGIFWETINYAAYAKLPVIFICENNKYSVFSPQEKRSATDNLSERVAAFGMRSTAVFGNDVMEVYRTLSREIELARTGHGAAFIEAYTYRWCGHYGPASDDLVGYRDPVEVTAWKSNCPIALLKSAQQRRGIYRVEQEGDWKREAEEEIRLSFEFAKSSPFPATPDWSGLNLTAYSPRSDSLLKEFQENHFDAKQDAQQVKGY